MPVSQFKSTFICLLKLSRHLLRFPYSAANFDLHVSQISYGSHAICSYANCAYYIRQYVSADDRNIVKWIS